MPFSSTRPSDFFARVERGFRGVAIFLAGVVDAFVGDADLSSRVRLERTGVGMLDGGAALFSGTTNFGGVEMLPFSLVPLSIGSGSSSATIQGCMPYSPARLSAAIAHQFCDQSFSSVSDLLPSSGETHTLPATSSEPALDSDL